MSVRAGAEDDSDNAAEIRVTWAELFFDLVFVFAVTGVSGLLRGDQSWLGVLRALVVFVPVYWCWVGASIHANTHDIENSLDRLGVFAVGLAGLFMALALPDAYGQRGVLFAASYYAARLVLVGLVRHGRRSCRPAHGRCCGRWPAWSTCRPRRWRAAGCWGCGSRRRTCRSGSAGS
jgi:low temperature requirement protein LtrA